MTPVCRMGCTCACEAGKETSCGVTSVLREINRSGVETSSTERCTWQTHGVCTHQKGNHPPMVAATKGKKSNENDIFKENLQL